MKIEYFAINGINNTGKNHFLSMNSDLNIITGRNGAGKTTTLKLLWLLISGNLKQAIAECDFESIQLSTDEYFLLISKSIEGKVGRIFYTDSIVDGLITEVLNKGSVEITYDENDEVESDLDEILGNQGFIYDHQDKRNSINLKYSNSSKKTIISRSINSRLNQVITSVSDNLIINGSSLYFPTFRRIEGGFSLGEKSSRLSSSSDLEEAMANLSKKFSKEDHLFVSSLSMSDVSQFLLKEYSNLNDISASQTNQLSQQVIGMIKSRKGVDTNLKEANFLLSDILDKIEKIEDYRTRLMRPLTTVQKVVSDIFKNKGINFGENLNFGDAASAINSDKLSAGEKQLLSFICYNAFFDDAVFIIDEPELSLHVDWQRSFFKILMNQNPSNQFIVTTHSPFIYGKYPDKEVALNPDRGENEG